MNEHANTSVSNKQNVKMLKQGHDGKNFQKLYAKVGPYLTYEQLNKKLLPCAIDNDTLIVKINSTNLHSFACAVGYIFSQGAKQMSPALSLLKIFDGFRPNILKF